MTDSTATVENVDILVDDSMSGKYLTFKVDDGDYGIEISYVTEIIKVQAITPVPHTPAYIKGITNLRGTIAPVIDMRLRFGHEETQYTDRTCIIVLGMNDISIGIIVDEVHEVANIEDGDIQPPPKNVDNTERNNFIKALGTFEGRVKQLLEIEKVFDVASNVQKF